MKRKLMILLFVFWGCLLSSAWAFEQSVQWATRPSYQFQSTSSCMSVVGSSSFAAPTIYAPCCNAPTSKPRRSETYNPWDEDGDGYTDPWGEDNDPSGQAIGQVDTPIGSPWILLVLAAGYLIIRRKKERA